ncbi:MAG: hypothetical protein DI529_10845, partial [Chryseobacterium sp.]
MISFFLGFTANGQIAEEFNKWTFRYEYGNYSQTTTYGVWNVEKAAVYPNAGNGISLPGFIELRLPSTTTSTDYGSVTTPNIAKGGARSAYIVAAVRPANVTYTELTRFSLQKSINGGAWQTIQQMSIATTSTLVAHSFTVPVNDFSDNIRFRIINQSGKPLFLDKFAVNHSFVVSSNNSTVCPNTPVTLSAQGSAPFNYTWTSSTGGNLVQTTGATVTANPSQNATYTAVGTFTTAFGTVTDTRTITVNTNTAPTATLTGSGTIDTEPGSVNLHVELTGTGPWSLTYNANGSNPQVITGITNSPYILTVSPDVTTTYSLTSVTDA